jgi:hypothetical protein
VKALTVFFPLCLLIGGCGVYSFSSSSLGGIKTIAVPQFENQSLEYGIQEDLTAAVIQKFIEDNTLKVVSLGEADAVLRGEISSYERVFYTYDQNDNVSEYKVNILVGFALEKKDGKVVLEKKNLLGFGVYSATEDTEDDGKQRAVEKLAQDIVDQTTKSW